MGRPHRSNAYRTRSKSALLTNRRQGLRYCRSSRPGCVTASGGSLVRLLPVEFFDHVIARQRYGIDVLAHLNVEDHRAEIAEVHFGAGEIELPHAAEALVIHLRRLLAVALEV